MKDKKKILKVNVLFFVIKLKKEVFSKVLVSLKNKIERNRIQLRNRILVSR